MIKDKPLFGSMNFFYSDYWNYYHYYYFRYELGINTPKRVHRVRIKKVLKKKKSKKKKTLNQLVSILFIFGHGFDVCQESCLVSSLSKASPRIIIIIIIIMIIILQTETTSGFCVVSPSDFVWLISESRLSVISGSINWESRLRRCGNLFSVVNCSENSPG